MNHVSTVFICQLFYYELTNVTYIQLLLLLGYPQIFPVQLELASLLLRSVKKTFFIQIL